MEPTAAVKSPACVLNGATGGLIEYESSNGQHRVTQLLQHAGTPEEFLTEHTTAETVKLVGSKRSAGQKNLATDPQSAGKLAEMLVVARRDAPARRSLSLLESTGRRSPRSPPGKTESGQSQGEGEGSSMSRSRTALNPVLSVMPSWQKAV